MPQTRFDEIVSREGTDALAFARKRHAVPEDATPLWIADMAFRAPEAVTSALAERVEHGIFGYALPGEAYFEALAGWFGRRHGWTVDTAAAVPTRGVVHALYLTLQALTEPGAGVIIQPPVYAPFFEAVNNTGRRVLTNPLVRAGRGYEIDFDQFEAQARQAEAFILCSPHNPVGRVWTRAELERMAEICLRHSLWIISDEVHADFVYPGRRHIVTATLDSAVDAATVTCTAPSKTFNLAGLQLANVFVPNRDARRRIKAAYAAQGLSQHPALGLVACQAAYGGAADAWVDQLVAYLDRTMTLIESRVAAGLPGVRFDRPEGTYLAWLDFSELGLDGPALHGLVVERARVWLSDGPGFGPGGEGFQRLNAAVPHRVLDAAFDRLETALAEAAARPAPQGG
ncbi:MAG: PatB family C-S lyase [Bifidobacteriaceae bacterium]|jgi:cystathionine beta-lyase|nr:PatB family C-S lyase [Bifidobacteriaceae bacterium]